MTKIARFASCGVQTEFPERRRRRASPLGSLSLAPCPCRSRSPGGQSARLIPYFPAWIAPGWRGNIRKGRDQSSGSLKPEGPNTSILKTISRHLATLSVSPSRCAGSFVVSCVIPGQPLPQPPPPPCRHSGCCGPTDLTWSTVATVASA